VTNSQAKPLQRELFLSDADADAHALYEQIRIAVDEVGFKEVLFRLGDCDRTTLSNRIHLRDGRRPDARLVMLLCQLQPSGTLVRFLCSSSGYAPPERLADEKPEEKLKRLVAEVRQDFGRAGERAIARAFNQRGRSE
jgi:hypothetical protein